VIWLRIALVIYALLYIVGGYFLVRNQNQGLLVGGYFLINGLVIIGALLFERGRYEPKFKTKDGWETTNERFIDDISGKEMVVRYNRRTGERDYVEERLKKKDKQ